MKPVRIRPGDEHEADGIRRTVLRVDGNTVRLVRETLGPNGITLAHGRGRMPADEWLHLLAGAGAAGAQEPPAELGGEGG